MKELLQQALMGDYPQLVAAVRKYLAAPMPEPVAWCELTPNGSITYFDGKPMVMCGPVGNECHTVPLYAAPPAAPAVPEGMKPVGYTHPFYLQVKQVGGFTCQYESFGLFTAPLYAAPVVREPLTDEQKRALIEHCAIVTGANLTFVEGPRYRSLGSPTNVKERHLFELIDAARNFGITGATK